MNVVTGLLVVLMLMLAMPGMVHAVCPLCTVAVIGGLGLSRYLGIDDSVTGLWIGGLILSSGLWLADWSSRKGWKLPYQEVLAVTLFFLLLVPPLYWLDVIGVHGNTLAGIDKLWLGMLAGAAVFLCGVGLDKWLRTRHAGKVYVYFQKVIIPVFLLSVASVVFYVITL